MKKYIQMTSEERYILSLLKLQALSIARIAGIMGRHRSTLYRELKKNSCHRTDGAYRRSKANSRTTGRRRQSRRNKHYSHSDFEVVRKPPRQKLSPEQIVGHIRRFRLMKRRMCHETIYQYIWKDKALGGSLWQHLRPPPKRRRKRYKAYDSRGRLANKRNISERPASIETRKYKGHWEIDTVHGRGTLQLC